MKNIWKYSVLAAVTFIATASAEGLVGEKYYYGGVGFQKFGDDLLDELFGMITIVGGGYNNPVNEKWDWDLWVQYGTADLDYSAIISSAGVTRKFEAIQDGKTTPIAFGGLILDITDSGDSSETDVGIYGGGGVEIVHNEKWFSRYTGSLEIRETNFLMLRGNWGYNMNEDWALLSEFGFDLNDIDVNY